MKILMFHCKRIEVLNKREERKWKKALLCFVCPSDDDSIYTLSKAIKEISKILKDSAENNVVLIPFVHLSQNPVSLSDAQRDVKRLRRTMEEKGYNVKTMELEKVDNVIMEVFGHRIAVAFRGV